MSNPYQNKAENANGDDDVLDLEVEFLEEEAAFLDEMREYYAPGGLYQQQQERNSKKQRERAENANSDDDDEADFLESMREYHAPGGLYQQQRERVGNANGDDDVLDLEAAFLEEEAAFLDEMREYHAPGGLYQQQQERNSKKNSQQLKMSASKVYATKKSTRTRRKKIDDETIYVKEEGN